METREPANRSERATRRSPGWRRFHRTPWASAVLCAAIVVWFESIPSNSELHDIVIPYHGIRDHFKQYTHILRSSHADGASSFEIIDEDQVSWDRLGQLQQDRPDDLVVMSVWNSKVRRSFAFPVMNDYEYAVSYFGTPFPPAEAIGARDLFVDHLTRTGNAGVAQRIKTGTTRWINPWGCVLNGLGVVLAGAFVSSLGWMSRSSLWRQGRRLRRGQCGTCAYDLSGTTSDTEGMAMCPECGTLNPRDASP